jgi:hypothetical protein
MRHIPMVGTLDPFPWGRGKWKVCKVICTLSTAIHTPKPRISLVERLESNLSSLYPLDQEQRWNSGGNTLASKYVLCMYDRKERDREWQTWNRFTPATQLRQLLQRCKTKRRCDLRMWLYLEKSHYKDAHI